MTPRADARAEENGASAEPERRRRADAPWWATSAWTIGPVGVGFLMLLSSHLGWSPSAVLRPANGNAAQAEAQRIVEIKRHVDQTDHLVQVVEQLVSLQRQTCFNTARDSAERAGCGR